ncbi:MAG: Zn-ribbon containing protein [Haloferacaceae archaeon]
MPHQCTNCGRTFADGSKEMLSGCPDCGGNKFQFRPAGTDDGADGEPAGDPPDPDPPDRGTFTDAAARAGAAVRDRFSSNDPEAADVAESEGSTAESEGSTSESGGATADSDSPDSEPAPAEWPDPTASSGAEEGSSPSGGDTEATRPRTGDTAGSSGTGEPSARSGTVDAADGPPSDEDREDRAQADARSGVVSNEELSAAARDVAEPTETPEASTGSDSPDAEPPPDADGTIVEPSSDDRPDLDELREELNDQFESIKIVNPGQYELNLMELYDRDEYIISLQEDGRYVIEVPDTWRDEE